MPLLSDAADQAASDAVDLQELRRAVRQLQDAEEIRLVKHRYFRCMDTANHEELRTLLHPELITELIGGTSQVRLRSADAYVDFVREMIHSGIVSQQNGHHPEINVLSDTEAEGRWYLSDMIIDLGQETRTYGTALFDDRYEKHEGRWVIRQMRYERIFEVIEDLDMPLSLTAHKLAEAGVRHPRGRLPVLPEDR